jgi:PKD repeat protein
VTIFARLLPSPGHLYTTLARRRVLAAAFAAAVLSALALAAAAGAVVTTVGGQQYGIEPQSMAAAVEPTTPLSYGGGPVVHSNATYAIYWDPESAYTVAWQKELSELFHNIGSEDNSRGNVFAIAGQYGEPVEHKVSYDSTFRGAYTDVVPFPDLASCTFDAGAPCLTDSQIREQLEAFIVANHLPTGLNPSTGATPIYVVFTPENVNVCAGEERCSNANAVDPLCSYHSFVGNPGNGLSTILYAVQPWTPVAACQDGPGGLQRPEGRSLAYVIDNEVVDEQVAAVTDPLLNGWHDTIATAGDEDEVTDKCRNDFLPLLAEPPAGEYFNQSIAGVTYYLNDAFNQAGLYNPVVPVHCANQATLTPEFTPQNPVEKDDAVTFNATETEATLGIAKYQWSFGDGTTAEVTCGAQTPTNHYKPVECDRASGIGNPNSVASVVHDYAYGGKYEVKLTVTDDGGNTESVTHTITVDGEPEPTPTPTPTPGNSGSSTTSTGAAAAGSSTTGSTTSNGTAPKPVLPSPVASTAVASSSLAKTIRSGLVVRYSVNEQVAGHFEVLLASAVAHRLGISGAPAVGLPAGSPAETVIAKAILVTTKGGRSTVHIAFSKRTAARLSHAHKVSLMLRLIVRNASTSNPTTTTVVSDFTLTG